VKDIDEVYSKVKISFLHKLQI